MNESLDGHIYMMTKNGMVQIAGGSNNNIDLIYVDEISRNYNNETDKPRTFAVKDLILAEIARIKLTNYAQFEKLDHIELGALDWIEFLTDINGKFDQTLNEVEYKGFKIKYTKEKWRSISLRESYSFQEHLYASYKYPMMTGGLLIHEKK
jgi:hypothetical protein